jgi:hypothetical protein
MTERKPPGEAWESFTERRIREAQAEGAFENLPGFGRPIPGIDEPLDENWWIREKLRREQINAVPPIIAARLEVEKTLVAIRQGWSSSTSQSGGRTSRTSRDRRTGSHRWILNPR